MPVDRRNRIVVMLTNFFLHLHPVSIKKQGIALSYGSGIRRDRDQGGQRTHRGNGVPLGVLYVVSDLSRGAK